MAAQKWDHFVINVAHPWSTYPCWNCAFGLFFFLFLFYNKRISVKSSETPFGTEKGYASKTDCPHPRPPRTPPPQSALPLDPPSQSISLTAPKCCVWCSLQAQGEIVREITAATLSSFLSLSIFYIYNRMCCVWTHPLREAINQTREQLIFTLGNTVDTLAVVDKEHWEIKRSMITQELKWLTSKWPPFRCQSPK